jgi:hypothetical protein
MSIIDLALVRNRLALVNQTAINEALTSAVDGAEAFVENILETTFDLGTYSDTFYVDQQVFDVVNDMYVLKLTNGLVRAAPSLEAFQSDSIDTIGTATASVTIRFVNKEKGMVFLPSELCGKYIRVDYDAGFVVDKGAVTYAEVPKWLREILVVYVLKTLSMQQVNDKVDTLSQTYDFIDKHIVPLLDSHLRKNNFAIPALGT